MTPAELQAIRERASLPAKALEISADRICASCGREVSTRDPGAMLCDEHVWAELYFARADRAALLAFVDKLEAGIHSAEESRMLARRRRLEAASVVEREGESIQRGPTMGDELDEMRKALASIAAGRTTYPGRGSKHCKWCLGKPEGRAEMIVHDPLCPTDVARRTLRGGEP